MPKHTLKHTIRGGQVVLHNLRMISQVLGKVTLWLLPVALLCSMLWFWCVTDIEARFFCQAWLSAKINLAVNGKHHLQLFRFADGAAFFKISPSIRKRAFSFFKR